MIEHLDQSRCKSNDFQQRQKNTHTCMCQLIMYFSYENSLQYNLLVLFPNFVTMFYCARHTSNLYANKLVLHVFYDCEKLQVGMHITCSGAIYRSCMHEKMRFHPCAFRSWAQNNWKGWIVWLGGLGVLINTLPNSWIFPQKQVHVDGVIYLELRTWRFYGQNTWFL